MNFCGRLVACIMLISSGFGCVAVRYGLYDANLKKNPDFYADNHLSFRPHRLWRVHLRWSVDPTDENKAYVRKNFQFVAITDVEKRKLKSTINAMGGEENYFSWLEARFAPLGTVDKRQHARIQEIGGKTVVDLEFLSQEPTLRTGDLRLQRYWIPDPFFLLSLHGCTEGLNPLLEPDEGFGIEVVLESHDTDPQAKRWAFQERSLGNAFLKTWSVGGAHWIAYRALVQVTKGMASCPVPPEFTKGIKSLLNELENNIGIQW